MYLLNNSSPMMVKKRLGSTMLTGEEQPQTMGGLFLTLVVLLHISIYYLINASNSEPVAKPIKIMEVTLVAVPLPVADVPPPMPVVQPPKLITPPKPLPPPPKPIIKPKPVVKPKPAPKKPEISKPKPAPIPTPIIEPTPLPPIVHSNPAPVTTPAPPKAAPAVSKPQPAKETFTQARADAGYGYNPKPKYPSVARSRGWTGKVILQVRVSADGEAEQVTVAQSSGHEILDEAAVSAVENWRFTPAKRGDTAVASTVRVPMNFQLDN